VCFYYFEALHNEIRSEDNKTGKIILNFTTLCLTNSSIQIFYTLWWLMQQFVYNICLSADCCPTNFRGREVKVEFLLSVYFLSTLWYHLTIKHHQRFACKEWEEYIQHKKNCRSTLPCAACHSLYDEYTKHYVFEERDEERLIASNIIVTP
jgi:hypothetical protein